MILSNHSNSFRQRRGSVIVIVLWAISLAAVVTTAVQLFSYRQATLGLETQQRLQARWAARAGLEQTIAVLADHTTDPYPEDAFAIVRDLDFAATGEVDGATWEIRHYTDGRTWFGPMDEHARMNINRVDHLMLEPLEDITPDIIDAIMDWRDEDDEVGGFGIERDYYLSLTPPYEPRNGKIRNIAELELVGGVWPREFRAEDWNLNNRMDPNENDGYRTFPVDEADDWLDTGWAGALTAYSVHGGATGSGLTRLWLRLASVDEVIERTGISPAQAQALINMGREGDADLEQLLFTPLSNFASGGNSAVALPDLTPDQLTLVLEECVINDPLDREPGKINLNSISPQLFRDLIEVQGISEIIADEILFLRQSQPQGITSLVELREIPEIDDAALRFLAENFTTISNVYTVTSRGRAEGSGMEVEIIAVVDRSTVPVKILEYREQ